MSVSVNTNNTPAPTTAAAVEQPPVQGPVVEDAATKQVNQEILGAFNFLQDMKEKYGGDNEGSNSPGHSGSNSSPNGDSTTGSGAAHGHQYTALTAGVEPSRDTYTEKPALAENKEKYLKAMEQNGIPRDSPQAKLMMAMLMMETNTIDTNERSPMARSKDGTDAENRGAFNMNWNMARELGFSLEEFRSADNDPAMEIKIMNAAMEKHGVIPTLQFHRGGSSDGTFAGARDNAQFQEYMRDLAPNMAYLNENPANMTSRERLRSHATEI